MTYYNPVYCFPEDRLIRTAAECGVDGFIIPDLSPEEGKPFMRIAQRAGIDTICFLAPTSDITRVKRIVRMARGFIYYVSITGVTGARQALPTGLKEQIERIRRYTAKPVCVGFGVSTPAQVREVGRCADGVIVGSAIVKMIKINIGKPGLVSEVSGFVAKLKDSLCTR
jgi:tryptophan synthase alpha chain